MLLATLGRVAKIVMCQAVAKAWTDLRERVVEGGGSGLKLPNDHQLRQAPLLQDARGVCNDLAPVGRILGPIGGKAQRQGQSATLMSDCTYPDQSGDISKRT